MAGGGRILEGGRFWAGFRVRRGSVVGRISGPEGGSGGGGPPPKNRRNSGVNSGFLRNCADPRVKITPKNPFLSSPRRPAGAPRGSRGPPRRPAGTPRGPPRGPAGPPQNSRFLDPKHRPKGGPVQRTSSQRIRRQHSHIQTFTVAIVQNTNSNKCKIREQ